MGRLWSFWSSIRLRGKILLSAGLPILVIVGLVAGLLVRHLRDELVLSSLARLEAELRAIAAVVDRANADCLTIARTLADVQSAGLFGNRAVSQAVARRVLEANPQLTGVYVGYEPNADGQDVFGRQGGELPEGSVDEAGRFLPYWVRGRDGGDGISLEPLVDMESSYYYRGTKNRVLGRPESEGIQSDQRAANSSKWTPEREARAASRPFPGLITEPYLYEGELIVEQAAPILRDGRFLGITGVDRTLGSLEEFLQALKPFRSSRITLISQRGRIVASTKPTGDSSRTSDSSTDGEVESTKGQKIEAVAGSSLLIDAYESEGGLAPRRIRDPETSTWVYLASAKVATGDWTVVLTVEESEILAPIRPVLIESILVTAAGLILVLGILLALAHRVSSRVRLAAETVRQVADGNLTVEVPAPRPEVQDETAQLLNQLNVMIRDLDRLVARVNTASLDLGSIAGTITHATSRQEEAVHDVAGAVAQTAAAVQEISATAHALSGTMNEVADGVCETAEEAGKGRERLAAIEAVMRNMAESGGVIAGRFAEIQGNSEAIRSVVTTIAKIAQQTNILSLNASIQAEKAGESGLGFSAVAREIRQLADRTEVATDDIRRIVEQMQSAVASGVSTVNQFSDGVRQEVHETVRIGAQFSTILERVEGLTPRFELLRESMRSQSDAAAQISDAMTSLTQTAHEASDAILEFHHAADRLNAAIDSLQERVHRFQFRTDSAQTESIRS